MQRKIQLACPAPAGSTQGNRVTALRWARFLRELGHRVSLAPALKGSPDLLIALHARRSAAAAIEFKRRFPDRPLIVALTGTDLYKDLPQKSRAAEQSLALADFLIVLHEGARRELAPAARKKTRVLLQSVTLPKGLKRMRSDRFEVCVLAHLRSVKDPLRTALAARRLPAESRIRVRHLGRALEKRLTERAERETLDSPRYAWLGERSHSAALRLLASCQLLVLSSRMEGGANVIGEAASLGVGILASDVPGNRGLLGARHPGLFEYGNTHELAELLSQAERDKKFYSRVLATSKRIAPAFTARRERATWRALCAEAGL